MSPEALLVVGPPAAHEDGDVVLQQRVLVRLDGGDDASESVRYVCEVGDSAPDYQNLHTRISILNACFIVKGTYPNHVILKRGGGGLQNTKLGHMYYFANEWNHFH